MTKIRKIFENFWEFKSTNKDYKEKDKERYYQLFLDGWGCALIDKEDSIYCQEKPKNLSRDGESGVTAEKPIPDSHLAEDVPK